VTDGPYRARRPSRRRRPGLVKLGLSVLALGIALAVGIALGQALDDGPQTGVTQTYVRTLTPLPQTPATQR
jgi:hypothetical protein